MLFSFANVFNFVGTTYFHDLSVKIWEKMGTRHNAPQSLQNIRLTAEV